jgi:hypothetical protein
LLDALAHLHLHEVPGLDQALGALDGSDVVGLRELALRRDRLWVGLTTGALTEYLSCSLQAAQALLGIAVGLRLGRVGIDDQVQLADRLSMTASSSHCSSRMSGQPSVSGGQEATSLLLDVAHRVVAEVASQSAAEARQARPQRHLEALLVTRDEIQRVVAVVSVTTPSVTTSVLACVAEAARAQQRARRQSDEAVAAEALAAHDGLEQEAVGAAPLGMRQLQVQRQGVSRSAKASTISGMRL